MSASLNLSVTPVSGSQNIAANTSQIDVVLSVTVSGSTYNQAMDDYGNITIDGTTVNIGAVSVPRNSTVTLYSARRTINHNTDGTKTVSVSAAYYLNTSSYGWLYASGGAALPTIARATTPTIGAVTLGSAVTIGLPRASSTFTHTVSYSFGGASGTIATGATTSVAWAPPLAMANQIPNSASGTGTITCYTYNGSTLIGTKSVQFTASVPASVKPTISACTVSPVNSNTWISGKGIYVAGFTTANVQTTAAGAYSSTIKSISITGGAGTGSGASWTSGELTSGAKTITVTITDSRGRTATTTKSITVQAYSPPAISNLSYQRGSYVGGVWTDNDGGEDLKATFTLGLSLSAYNNTASLSVAVDGETTQTTTGAAAGNKTYYFTTIGVDVSRLLTISATDSTGCTASMSRDISTVAVPLNFNRQLNAIRIGGVAEDEKRFRASWPAVFDGAYFVAPGINSGADKTAYDNEDPTATAPQNQKLRFSLPIEINGNTLDDYVVEQGTSGIWTYRKWNSGFCECWGKYATSVAFTNHSSVNTNIYSGGVRTVNYPFTITGCNPVVTLTQPGYAAMQLYAVSDTSFSVYPYNFYSATLQITLNCYLSGRWK